MIELQRGVIFRPDRNKWRARIRVNKKEYALGCFENYKDAVKARKEAEEKLYATKEG